MFDRHEIAISDNRTCECHFFHRTIELLQGYHMYIEYILLTKSTTMNNTERKYDKYNNLITDLKNMIDNKGQGYEVAQALNDELWEEVGTHRKRMEEQVNIVKSSSTSEQLQREIATADSIYEATRNFISKYRKIEN